MKQIVDKNTVEEYFLIKTLVAIFYCEKPHVTRDSITCMCLVREHNMQTRFYFITTKSSTFIFYKVQYLILNTISKAIPVLCEQSQIFQVNQTLSPAAVAHLPFRVNVEDEE